MGLFSLSIPIRALRSSNITIRGISVLEQLNMDLGKVNAQNEHPEATGNSEASGNRVSKRTQNHDESPPVRRNKRPASSAANREASTYKNHQQRRAQNHKEPLNTWSTWRTPNTRVDASATRVLQARDRVRNEVQAVVRKAFGNKYRVEYFGSTRYGVSHAHSDLDMVVIDPDYPQGYLVQNIEEPIYNVRKLATAMRQGGFVKIEYRKNATVALVKFKHRYTGLECDLNVNERLGVINSDMIKKYCDISPVLRPMLFHIKEWAKGAGLNSPSGANGMPASFSSYALVLMTIVFLQSKGLLPNLQADLPPLSNDQTLIWTRRPHRGWDARYSKKCQFTPPQAPDIKTLLLQWYQLWSTFPCEEKCASIRHGAILNRNSLLLPEYVELDPPAPICVIDPFIRSKNVTVAVSRKVLQLFRDECNKAADVIRQQTESSATPTALSKPSASSAR